MRGSTSASEAFTLLVTFARSSSMMLGRAPSTDVLNCASLTDLPVANRDSKELAGDAPGLAGSSVSGSRLRTAISAETE